MQCPFIGVGGAICVKPTIACNLTVDHRNGAPQTLTKVPEGAAHIAAMQYLNSFYQAEGARFAFSAYRRNAALCHDNTEY